MIIPILIVEHRPALYAFFSRFQVDENLRPFLGGPGGWGSLNRQFQGIQETPGIPRGYLYQVFQGPFLKADLPFSIASFPVVQGPTGSFKKGFFGERLKLENTAPAHEGPVYFEKGIFGGGPNKNDRTVFYPGEEGILLGLVPAVNLIDKQDGPLAIEPPPVVGPVYRFPDVLDARQNRVKTFKAASGGIGYDPGKACFSRTWRAVKDKGRKPVRLYGTAEEAARADDVVLANDFIECTGPHPVCQRTGGRARPFSSKQVIHDGAGL